MNSSDKSQVLLAEYDNMLRAIEMHQLELRRYQTYLTYLVSLGSVALSAVSGANAIDLSSILDAILQILLAPIAPLLLLVLSFAAAETQQMYIHARQMGNLEIRINDLAGDDLLTWEHHAAIRVYGRDAKHESRQEEVFQVVRFNSAFVLGPLAVILLVGATIVTTYFLNRTFGQFAAAGYAALVVYLAVVVAFSWTRVNRNMSKGGPLFKVFDEMLEDSLSKSRRDDEPPAGTSPSTK